jgi:Protein of unknown function (DUF3575)
MKKKLLVLTTILFTVFCQSQIKVYTPSSSSTANKDNSYKWAVKTDLFAYVGGEFPVAFEYRIAKKISVEASAGITYAFIPNDFLTDSKDDFPTGDSEAALGSAFRGTVKYYPSADYDAIEGWYFGLQLFSKTTNRDYVESNNFFGSALSSDISYNGKRDTRTKTGLSLVIGKQIFQDSNIVFESYIGIGLANVTRKFYITDNEFLNNNSVSTVIPKETSKSVPNFQLGLKIGFGN